MSASMTKTTKKKDSTKQQSRPPSSGSRGGKKRKAAAAKKNKGGASAVSPEERYESERTERYEKLRHATSTALRREAKVVKSFECQKVVRAIKEAKQSREQADASRKLKSNDGDEDRAAREGGDDKSKSSIIDPGKKNDEKARKRIEALERKLERTKRFDLDALVTAGLKRMGVLNLDPRWEDGNNVDDSAIGENYNSGNEDTTTSNKNDGKSNDCVVGRHDERGDEVEQKFHLSLLEAMLRHKRLLSAADGLDEKVTEYRRWVMSRQNTLRDLPHFFKGDDAGPGRKSKKRKKSASTADAVGRSGVVAEHVGNSGIFIDSLSGAIPDGGDAHAGRDGEGGDNDDDGKNYYGYGGEAEEPKKNRMGQRQRKAKAVALEAKKAGRTWDSSVNWREKKKERASNAQEAERGGDRGGRDDGKRRDDGRRDRSDGGAASHRAADAGEIAAMGKTWKEDGKSHPSWAARQAAQKAQGIAEFKGTKITFD